MLHQLGSQPRFGAVHLEHQDGVKPNVDLKKMAAGRPQWESHDVVSLDKSHGKETLASVSQSKDAKTDVRFFNGKGGFSAIVTTGDMRFIALPGSRIDLPDTSLELPGQKITGGPVGNDRANERQPVQNVTKQAMIIAAGESSRFEPLTLATEFTKHSTPLIGNDSVIVSIAKQLYGHGIRHIIVNTCFKPEKIEQGMARFNKELEKEGKEPVEFSIYREKAPSGDAGGLLVGLQEHPEMLNPNEHLLTIYGDAVTADVDFSAFLNAAKEHDAKITLGAKRVTDNDLKSYGFVVTDQSGKDKESGFIKEFVEKPGRDDEKEGAGRTSAEKMARLGNSRLANTGILVFSPKVFGDYRQKAESFQKENKLFSWSYHFFPSIREKYGNKSMWAERLRGYWSDIGNPEQYIATVKDIRNGKLGIESAGKVQENVDEQGVLYWPDTRAKVEGMRSQAQSEGSPFHLEGNIVVANTSKE